MHGVRAGSCFALVLALGACGAGAKDDQAPEELSLRVHELGQTLQAERAAHEVELLELEHERERLECELAELRGDLLQREDDWLRTMQTIGAIKPDAVPANAVANKTETDAPAPVDEREQQARDESAKLLRALQNLI